ncbi:MAG: vWA domain-containing protein [Terriglobia bacterium]|jgi:hypothetical protein
MVSKTILFALLFVTGLNISNLPAQDSPCTKRTIAVGVVDYAWNLVPNLTAANFRGKLRGHDVQILSAALDTNPRHIVMLLDASGSMMEPSEGWETEKSSSEYLIRFGPQGASIAQMAFAASVLDTEGFAQEPLTLMKNLHALVDVCERRKVGGPTALFDAILNARGLLAAPKLGDLIYALTDAGDNKSQTKARKAAEQLGTAGMRFFAVLIRRDVQDRARTPEELEGPNQLQSVVNVTGGNMLTLPLVITSPVRSYYDAKTRQTALDLALQRLYQQMGEFYRVELKLPGTVDKPTKWKLNVIDANGKPMRGVEVHYPQELMPCAMASP